jgi:hypothetical protein
VPATAGPQTAATISQAGAGILNVAAALSGTVAANPTALNFGSSASGAFSRTLRLSLTNLRMSSDSLTLIAVPAGGAPAPVVSLDAFDIAAGDTQDLGITLNTSGIAPGEYQGYIQVTTVNGPMARIPYWFAVQGSDPSGISILYQEYAEPRLSNASSAVIFRVVDQAGLPYSGSVRPQATIVSSGNGSARTPYRIGSIPGTYAIDVSMGDGPLQLVITIAGVSQSVLIAVI